MIKEMYRYIETLKDMDMDMPGQERALKQVADSGITVNDGPVACSYVPMIITKTDMETFQQVLDGLSPILSKMTHHYVENQEYRKIFGFSKEMEELICLPCDYPCVIPFGRYDLFYNFEDGKYRFCEINTDGSGGMSWNDKVTDAILTQFGNQSYIDAQGIMPYNATEAFARGIMETYHSSPHAVSDPLIAIVDFKEEGVMTDFAGIIQTLVDQGVRARFTDIRDLKLQGDTLIDKTDGQIIHGIYRRAVTSVVLERFEECQTLIEAVRKEAVVLMGHFRTSLAHSKTVFAAMYHHATKEILTETEYAYIKAHIPATYILRDRLLTEAQLEEVRKNKDHWVLKPEEGFGSYGVCCGMDVTEQEWSASLDDAFTKPYILQAFCPRYTIPVVRCGSREIEEYPLMLGIFQTNGKVASCYNRAGKAGVIDYSHGCVCVGTCLV